MKRTSTEVHVYMRRHQDVNIKHFDVSNVIYHKFSHGAVSYTLNGENVNVMLGLFFSNCLIMALIILISIIGNIYNMMMYVENLPGRHTAQ